MTLRAAALLTLCLAASCQAELRPLTVLHTVCEALLSRPASFY